MTREGILQMLEKRASGDTSPEADVARLGQLAF